ncbi:MAG TPA: M23 family metallopeptidase [Acidisarcina sp.]
MQSVLKLLIFVALIFTSQLSPFMKLQAGGQEPVIRESGPSVDAGIEVAARPYRPFIEERGDQQFVNVDLLLRNRDLRTYRLVAIKLAAFDRHDHLELERELNENGTPPGLDVVGNRNLAPDALIDIFQPLMAFSSDVDLHRIHLELFFMEKGHSVPPVVITADKIISIDLHPRKYTPAAFCLPLHGLLLVHDGHDFYSHHRRYNLAARYGIDPASAVSANLYAYDLMKVPETGELFRGDPHRKENWLTYGEPVFAPAEGVVIEAVSNVPENTFGKDGEAQIPPDAEKMDPMGLGNHVKIKHRDGRVSWFLHLQLNSKLVSTGDHVRAGQQVGKVGFSGDSLFPHLHYTVTDGAAYPSQGVPSYFKQFTRVVGERRITVSQGQIDTGDLIETRFRQGEFCGR